MNRKVLTSVLTALLCASFIADAQDSSYIPAEVSISKEKVRVGDTVYYSHVVLERQTLYSICKTYGVSVEEVYAANPELELETKGLKKNSILRIPIHEQEKERNKADNSKAATDRADKDKDSKFITHVVKWYEDLKAIAANYEVSVEDIIRVNKLKDERVKARTKLLIPRKNNEITVCPEETEAPEVADIESVNNVDNGSLTENQLTDEISAIGKSDLHFALILPLKASTGTASVNYMDFYSGSLLAAKDLKDQGIKVKFSVYDDALVMPVFTKDRIAAYDAIIGPVSKNNMKSLLDKAPVDATIISPLDPKTGSLTKAYHPLCQANTDNQEQYSDMAEWIKSDLQSNDKVMLVYEKSKTQLKVKMDSLLRAHDITYSEVSYNILEGRNIGVSMESKMTKGGENRIIIASESEAFVNDVIRNLNVAVHDEFSVSLYGPSKFKSFETIDIEHLHNVKLHMSLSYNIDYDSEKVIRFIKKYRAIYGTEPNSFAYQAYDICTFLAEAYSKYGSDWREYVEDKTFEMLQCNICFRKNGAGYKNTAIRRVLYGPDCSMEVVR